MDTEWMNKMWYIHTVTCHAAVCWNTVRCMLQRHWAAKTVRELKEATQKRRPSVLFCSYELTRKGKSVRQKVDQKLSRAGLGVSLIAINKKKMSWGDKNILKLGVGMVARL